MALKVRCQSFHQKTTLTIIAMISSFLKPMSFFTVVTLPHLALGRHKGQLLDVLMNSFHAKHIFLRRLLCKATMTLIQLQRYYFLVQKLFMSDRRPQ
jgi:hypothetical protein